MSKKDKDEDNSEKDNGSNSQPTVKQQIVEAIKNADSLVISVGKDPSRDTFAAAIALHLMLTKLEKVSEVVISNNLPKSLEFLPHDFINEELKGQKDFVIEVDQTKTESDSLKYLREGDKLKIYITPYDGTYSEKDVSFSDGDYHYNLVIGLGASAKSQLDKAITSDKKLTDKVEFAFINNDADGGGDLSWSDVAASSVSEMVMSMSEALGGGMLDKQISTALLTGIVDKTDHFTNTSTTPKVMTMAAQLLAAGANQAEVVKNQKTPPPEDEPAKEAESDTKSSAKDEVKEDESKSSKKDKKEEKKTKDKDEAKESKAEKPAEPDGEEDNSETKLDETSNEADKAVTPAIEGDEPSPDAIADMIKVGSSLIEEEEVSEPAPDNTEKADSNSNVASSLVDAKPRERVIEPPTSQQDLQPGPETNQQLDQQDLESQNILESIKQGGSQPISDNTAVTQGLSGVGAAAPSSDSIDTFTPGSTLESSSSTASLPSDNNLDSGLSNVSGIDNQTLTTGGAAAPFNEASDSPKPAGNHPPTNKEGHIDIDAARKAAEEAYNSMHLDASSNDENQPQS